MSRKPYPTDLTDEQWERLDPLLPGPKSGTPKGGHPVTVDRREVVHAISYHLRAGGRGLLGGVRHLLARVREVIADSGFSERFQEFVRKVCRWAVTITANAEDGFKVHTRRWAVERTFAWFVRYRRLVIDYECHPETSEAMIQAAMIHRMLRSLHPNP